MILAVLVPVATLVVVVLILAGLYVVNSAARWEAVNKSCPELDGAVAADLGLVATPLADDGSRGGGHDDPQLSNCFYGSDGEETDGLHVAVLLSGGGLLHGSHAEAIQALDDNPPRNFRPLGDHNSATSRFGDRGPGSMELVLINVVDNAQIRVQYHHRNKIDEVSGLAFRDPLQSVADQAVANLG